MVSSMKKFLQILTITMIIMKMIMTTNMITMTTMKTMMKRTKMITMMMMKTMMKRTKMITMMMMTMKMIITDTNKIKSIFKMEI